jgi:chemotaxis protein MotB
LSANNQAPYRIVKKVVQHGGHHGGAWKVAYADFVTAMMALFIVLWILGQSDQVKQNIARYFQNPGVFKEGGTSILMGDKSKPIDNGMDEFDPMKNNVKDKYALLQKLREEQVLREAGRRLMGQVRSMPKFKDLAEQIQVKMTADGLRIELTDRSNSEFFELGNATPKQATVDLLKIISNELGNLPNTLSIEGHTDSRPFVSRAGYGNWELSADRANSARRIMETSGLQSNQVEAIRGYADRQLLMPKDPLDMRNRRVSILVRYTTSPSTQKSAAPEQPAAKSQPAER